MANDDALNALTNSLFSRATGTDDAVPAQVVASPAAPANVTPLRADVVAVPSAPVSRAPADDLPEETLDEAVARAIGTEPVPTAASPAAAAQPETPLTPREQEMAARLAEFESAQEQGRIAAEYQRQDQEWTDSWNTRVWQVGYQQYGREEAAIREQGRSEGWSEREILGEIYLKVDAPQAQQDPRTGAWYGKMGRRQWEAVTTEEQLLDQERLLLSRFQPSELDQLVSQYHLTSTHKQQLMQFAAQPDVMRRVAAVLGGEVAATQTRDQAVVMAARDSRANQMIEQGFGPGAGNALPATPRRTHRFTPQEHASGAAGASMASIAINRFLGGGRS